MGSLKFQVSMEWVYLKAGINTCLARGFSPEVTPGLIKKSVDLILDSACYLHDVAVMNEKLDQPGPCFAHYRPRLHQLCRRYKRREVEDFYTEFGGEEKERALRLLCVSRSSILSPIFQLIPSVVFGKHAARWLHRDYNLPYPDFDICRPAWKEPEKISAKESIQLWENARSGLRKIIGSKSPYLGCTFLLGDGEDLPFSWSEYLSNRRSARVSYIDERIFKRLSPVGVAKHAMCLSLLTADLFTRNEALAAC